MAVKQSEAAKQGYAQQSQVLANRLHENFKAAQMRNALEWAAIPGVRVNYSFFEKEKDNYSKEEVTQALCDLGIDINKCPGKKWYQFSKIDWDTKLINAIKQINY